MTVKTYDCTLKLSGSDDHIDETDIVNAGVMKTPGQARSVPHVSFGDIKARKRVLSFDNWKLYLDSCSTYYYMFMGWCLRNVHKVNVALNGHYNGGVSTTKKKGYYGL